MQILGFILILIVFALGAWWATGLPINSTDDTSPSPSDVDAIDTARDAPDVTLSNENVEVYGGISVPKDITILDVSGRGLEGSLKAEVGHLSQLKVLDVSRNNFTGLPAEVGQLSELEVLNLSNNPVTGLPQELGNLSNLQELDLRGTQYSEADLEIIKSNLPDSTVIFTDE